MTKKKSPEELRFNKIITGMNPKAVPTFLVGMETKIGIGAEPLGINPSDSFPEVLFGAGCASC